MIRLTNYKTISQVCKEKAMIPWQKNMQFWSAKDWTGIWSLFLTLDFGLL